MASCTEAFQLGTPCCRLPSDTATFVSFNEPKHNHSLSIDFTSFLPPKYMVETTASDLYSSNS